MNKDILYRLKAGDENSFNELYFLLREPAIRFCNSIIKDTVEAENLVQEVFIKIWERRQGINPELNFTSYLFTIIRNRVFDYLKEVKKINHLKERYWENIVKYPESDQEFMEERFSKVNKVLEGLTEKRKEIILLNYKEGKSYEEIATQMNISKNTVKNQLVKAKQIMRKQLKIASIF